MSSVLYIVVILFVLQAIICSQQEKCAVLEFYHLEENNLWVLEDQYANVTFGINVSACDHSNTLYKITVQTRTNNESLEYDGTITYLGDACAGIHLKSVRCLSPTGPAELNRKVNRSHVGIRWEWVWKNTLFNNFTTEQKELKLTVAYAPSVTRLTVNGHDVNNSHLIVEGQTVHISCSFDKGVPPANFRLVDELGKEINSSREETHLNASITAQCYQDWASVRCEGNASKNNISVSFLVKCSHQFIDKSPKIIDIETQELWMFRIKAHSTAIQKCLLAPSAVGENKNKEVNCTLTGSPPNLLLTVFVDKEECSKSGHWALTLFNEKGSSDMLVFTTHFRSRGGNAQNETTNGNEGERTSKKSDSSTSSPGQAAGNGSKSGGSTPRSSSSGSDKPSTNPNYTSTALQEVEIHAYMDLHTRDPTYASTTSSKDPHTYMELKTLRAQSDPQQPGGERNGNDGYETPQMPGRGNQSSDGYETPQPPREGRRRSALYANQGISGEAIQEEVDYYNEA